MNVIALFLSLFLSLTHAQTLPNSRVASLFVSQDLINEQLAAHAKSNLVKDLKITLDADHDQIFLRGILHVPVEELRAINLDPTYGAYRFQVTIKAEMTKEGFFILEFPLAETFFYPASSKDPDTDRVIVPVQMLSLVLASVRGYMAALSGDFSGFDRRTQKLKAQVKDLTRQMAKEKDPDLRETYKIERDSVQLKLASVPIERKQLEKISKTVEHMLGFANEKELNFNDDLKARRNALVLKIKLSQLAPYLDGVELGGIRILHDNKDGGGENYLAIDMNSTLSAPLPAAAATKSPARTHLATPPALIMRLNQSLFESTLLLDTEKKKTGTKIKDLEIQLKDDGLHVSGRYKAFFFSIPFDAIVDFVMTKTDVFEIRVREMKVEGLDFSFLTKFALEAIESRLGHALGSTCTFDYVGEEKDHSRAVQVTLKPKNLVPAFPQLHLVEVDVRDREFLLKLGAL